jgi:hypothetical protein
LEIAAIIETPALLVRTTSHPGLPVRPAGDIVDDHKGLVSFSIYMTRSAPAARLADRPLFKGTQMPVSPTTTDAYVSGSNLVDVIVSHIDRILCSSEEKYYRHGSDDDYFYTLAFAIGHLDDREMATLRQAYVSAGWGNVQVRNFHEEDLAAKFTVVRIFRKKHSQFSTWSAK